MDAQLKALKVVDLKAILAKAQVHAPAKANKNDLIAKILGAQPALDVYKQLYDTDDLLAPPEDVDWNTEQEQQKPAAEPPAPVPAVVEPSTAPAAEEDPEAEKRRKRAERFGIPLVEPPKPRAARVPKASTPDTKNLDARAARFGTTNTNKRPPPTENVDPEEEEKRRKRAERFGTGTSATKV